MSCRELDMWMHSALSRAWTSLAELEGHFYCPVHFLPAWCSSVVVMLLFLEELVFFKCVCPPQTGHFENIVPCYAIRKFKCPPVSFSEAGFLFLSCCLSGFWWLGFRLIVQMCAGGLWCWHVHVIHPGFVIVLPSPNILLTWSTVVLSEELASWDMPESCCEHGTAE